MNIRLLLVPYDSGRRDVRMGAGPQHLCALGLEKHLADNGHLIEREVIERRRRAGGQKSKPALR
jgi:arginase